MNFEKRLEDIKSKRDILSHTIPQRISENEEEEAYKWWTNHKCLKEGNKWPETEIGCIYPAINLSPTSIGTIITIICPKCGKTKDVSDYEMW